jgi:hypothetical protein
MAPAPGRQLIAILLGALALRLAWLGATGYAYEDAYITFQYARNLAAGNGFVYNPGEPIYGASTPLLTLLIAGWLLIVPGDPLLGARLIGIAAGLGGIAFVWGALGRLGMADVRRVAAVLLLAVAEKLWVRDTGGMETPLVLCFMAASLYTTARGAPIAAGICGGLLLWVRIDAGVWLAALALAEWWYTRRLPLRMPLVAALCYAPWLIYAAAVFGSPLPYTATAKWVAYAATDATPPWGHALTALRWMTPFTLRDNIGPALLPGWSAAQAAALVGTLIICFRGARTAWQAHRLLAVLPLFFLLELARLAITRATFHDRYFVPLLWCALLLLGLGIGALAARPRLRWGGLAVAIATVVGCLIVGAREAGYAHAVQQSIHEGALTAIGRWINANAPLDATVLLEPLGYAGYHAQRRMLDDVGLVTPAVVDLKRQGRTTFDALAELRPDYIVTHCDVALAWLARDDAAGRYFAANYTRATQINPLRFDPRAPPAPTFEGGLAWAACYEIWGPRRS